MEIILQPDIFGNYKTLAELEREDKMRGEKNKIVNYKPIKCNYCRDEIKYGEEIFLNADFNEDCVYCSESCREFDCNFYSVEQDDEEYNEFFEKE